MLNNITKSLKVLCDNKASEEAILNVLHAKLAHLFSFKAVKFNSYKNLNTSYPISYYGFNFVPSGGVKNLLINEIDNNLLPFLRDECSNLNKKQKTDLECQHALDVSKIMDKTEKNRKELDFNRKLDALS